MNTLGKLSMSDFQICLNLKLVDYHPLNLEAHIIVGDTEVERFALQSVTMDTWSSRTVASLPANVADFCLAISGTIQELHQALGYVEVSSVDLFGRCLSFEDVYITSAQLDSGNIQAMQIQFCYTYSICEFIQRLELTSSPESTFTPDIIDNIQEVFIMFSEPVILSDKSALKFIQKAISEMHVSKHDMRLGYLSKMVQLFDQKYKSMSNTSYLHNAVETLACMSTTFQPDRDKLPPQLTKQGESIQKCFDWWKNSGGIGSDQITNIFEVALQHIPDTFLGHSRPLSIAAWYLQQIDPKLWDRAIANYEATQANLHMKPDCEVSQSLKNALNRPIRLFGDVEDPDQASQILSIHRPPSYDPNHQAPWWVWIQRSLRHLNPGGMMAVVLLEEMAQVPTLLNFKKELGLLAFELYPHPTTWLEQGLFWDLPDTPWPLHTFGQGITPAFYDAVVEMTQSVAKSFVPQLHAFIEGLVLHIRFLVYNDLDDLDKSIQLGLGEQFSSQHLSPFITPAHLKALVKSNVSDLKQALPIFINCAKSRISVSIGPQLLAATWWGIIAIQLGKRDLAMAGYIKALNILPEVPWIGLPLEECHKQLYYNESLVLLASAAALEFRDPYRTIEWLEQGRSVIWNQLLQLRVTTERLEKVDPDLAKRFASMYAELQADKAGSLLNTEDWNEEFLSRAAQVAEICYSLVSEREDLINSIRQLPGFETFLLPHTMDQLREAAQHGPIVILNASRYPDKCDALVLLSDLEEVIHIPLHNMPHS
ncbi:hypothetical protein AX16_006132 [Volvariella volvacea WC 439]|nr:hypothetical protein AX16_006132 [Volvariella volvacea WC 439]